MNRLSKSQWQLKIIELAKNQPQDRQPDDQVMMQILTDVIVSEQTRLKPKNLAMLAGMTAALLERVKASFPAATYVNDKGEKVFTEAEVAANLGISIEEVRKACSELEQEFPDEKMAFAIDPRSLHRIN